MGPPAESWYLPEGPLLKLFAEFEAFAELQHRGYVRTITQTAASFVNFRRSLSGHQLLPAKQLNALLDALAKVIEANGGGVELRLESHLYTAPCRG